MNTDASTDLIRPGSVVIDDRGEVAQLHGIGVQRIGDRYWAWGEDKRAGATFTAVAAYSTEDFAHWRYEGDALTAIPGHPDLDPSRIVERPKVLWNAASSTYVMFLHVDDTDYAVARVGYAVSDSPQGPFTYLHSERPLGNISRDIGVYQEGGDAYLLSEDRDHGLHIYRLAADYLSAETIVSTSLKPGASYGYESPTLIWNDGLYMLFGSDLTGWSANDNKVATAKTLAGPWDNWQDFAPSGSATFQSQVSVVVPHETANGMQYIYIGDRWLKDDLYHSPLVVLPLTIEREGARVTWRENWALEDFTASR